MKLSLELLKERAKSVYGSFMEIQQERNEILENLQNNMNDLKETQDLINDLERAIEILEKDE